MENDNTPNENNNKIPTSNRASNTGKQIKMAGLVVSVILIALAVLGTFIYKLSGIIDKGVQTTSEKSEGLMNKTTTDNSLAQKIKELEEQKRQEEERKKLLEEKAKREAELKVQVQKVVQAQQEQVQNNTKKQQDPNDPRFRKMQGSALFTTRDRSQNQEADNGSINAQLMGEDYIDGSVKELLNRDKLLIAGTTLPCVLKTKIVTNYPSIPICQITQNVYSSTGDYVLIPKGSVVRGEQKKALTQGDVRVFISWNTIDTTTGQRVRIDSLGTDPLGASGNDAYINYRFWKRFGGAIMLSFIQDAISTVGQRVANKGAENITYESSEKNLSKMAEMALQNSINIAPLGYVNQGEIVNILLVRDIDFSGFIDE